MKALKLIIGFLIVVAISLIYQYWQWDGFGCFILAFLLLSWVRDS